MSDCIFCNIVQQKTRSKIVFENDKYIVIENINPQAPVHVLIMPKMHIEKKKAVSGKIKGFWDEMMQTANVVIKKYGLDKTGYRLVNNGAGYNHIDHEHVHLIGGKSWSPNDNL